MVPPRADSNSGRGSSGPPQFGFSRRTPQGSSNRRRVLDEESAQTHEHAGFGRPCGVRPSLVARLMWPRVFRPASGEGHHARPTVAPRSRLSSTGGLHARDSNRRGPAVAFRRRGGGADDGTGDGERHDRPARHVGDARERVRRARPRHVTPAVDWLCGAGPAARRLQRLLGRAARRARRRSDQARRAGGVLRALSTGQRRGGPDSDRVARVPARSRRPHPALAFERDGRRQPRLAGHVRARPRPRGA